MKKLYITGMEKVLNAYSVSHIKRYMVDVEKHGLEEPGFPRLTANIGILIAHGRRQDLKDDFIKMMDLCCSEIPTARGRNGRRVGNEFSVKEIVCCLLELEKSGVFDKSLTDRWREELSKINPYLTYSLIASFPPFPMHNWAAFGAVSEQLRKYAGISDESFFIENQVASQLDAFDENGMYRDPKCPLLYDFVARLDLAAVLHYGFDGEGAERLREYLIKSADITLHMQSVTGEVPFGGRSNQFLHNEPSYAALCEFYAVFFKNLGDIQKAGMFKRAARISTDRFFFYISDNPVSHIKNLYPTDSMYGCEEYAYYDKYMITAASQLYAAYSMADDTIKEFPCPSEIENYICETSEDFHQTMMKFGDYFVQLDTAANEQYDASGIGRIHRKGAPSAICLSVPFTKNPKYYIDLENPSPLSICAGIKTNDGFVYSCDEEPAYTVKSKEITDDFVKYEYDCENESGVKIKQICTISESGVELAAIGDGDLEILFPIFDFDGKTSTEKVVAEKSASIKYKGWKCNYTTDGKLASSEKIYANRNGHYIRACAKGKNRVTLRIEIEEI